MTKDEFLAFVSEQHKLAESKGRRSSTVSRALRKTLVQHPNLLFEEFPGMLFDKEKLFDLYIILCSPQLELKLASVMRLLRSTQYAVRNLMVMRTEDTDEDLELFQTLRFALKALASVWGEVGASNRLRSVFDLQALFVENAKNFPSLLESSLDYEGLEHSVSSQLRLSIKSYNNRDNLFFNKANKNLTAAMEEINLVLPHLVAELSQKQLRKSAEYHFVYTIGAAWFAATGKVPTITHDGEHATPFQRFIAAATPSPHIGLEVLRNVVEHVRLNEPMAKQVTKLASKSPKTKSPKAS